MIEKPNNSMSYKSMKHMDKKELCNQIKAIDKNETIDPWNYKKSVLMDILNYHLNRNAKEA